MKLKELKEIQSLPWLPIPDDVIAFMCSLQKLDPEAVLETQHRERWLEEEVTRASSQVKLIKDELIYVAIGNAQSKDDFLRLVSRYGTPDNRDLDHDVLREYEALCEAVYRVSALLAYGEGFGEFSDVEQIVEVNGRYPSHEGDITVPASIDLIVKIPDYRRVILPNEVRVEDINDVYWPPMFNPVRPHTWKESRGYWYARGLEGRPENGMRKYRLVIETNEEGSKPHLASSELRFFCGALAREVANEQVRDMQLTFYDGEVDLFDPFSDLYPPVWRLVWLALCMANNKTIPGICRACGKLIDRRGERRNKTLSCNNNNHKCTTAFNNNGKRRMIKRMEWGRSFLPDEHFSYISEIRRTVLDGLAEQKANPNWPPETLSYHG